MDIEIQEHGHVVVITPHERRLDAIRAAPFRAATLAHIKGRNAVVLSLKDVEIVDSSGLSAIVALLKALGAGGQVRLVAANDSIQKLLKVTRLHQVFQVDATVEDAVARLHGPVPTGSGAEAKGS